MLLEVLADHRQHGVVDEAADGVLHHLLVFAQAAADVEKVDRVEGSGHGKYLGTGRRGLRGPNMGMTRIIPLAGP